MRSMKGAIYSYARRQARREFNKAYNSYKRNTYTNDSNDKVEYSDDLGAALICILVLLGLICFIGSLN